MLATASKIAGRPLPSFTIKVPLPALDEAADARESSSHIGGAATVIEAEAGVLAENYAELTRAAEYPVLDTSSAALLALSRNVHAQGYKVVLSGEGADEAFAGYVWFKIREAARKLDIGDSFRPSTGLSRIARKVAARNLSFGEFARIDAMIGGPHAQSIMYNLVATSRDRYYSAELKERLGSFVAYEDLALDLERMRRWHPLNRSLYLGCKVHLAGLLLNQKGDRVAMANSVEARYPFLDEDVITFASRIHPRWKLRGLMGDKYLLRQAAARILPDAVAQRKKAMFRAPLAETFLAKPPSFVRDLVSPDSLARTGYFNAAAVQRDCAVLAQGERKLGTFASLGLGGVVATQLWHHLYLGGGLCELPHVEHQAGAEPAVATLRCASGLRLGCGGRGLGIERPLLGDEAIEDRPRRAPGQHIGDDGRRLRLLQRRAMQLLWAAEIGGAELHARCAERIGLILHATLCPQSKAKCRHVRRVEPLTMAAGLKVEATPPP